MTHHPWSRSEAFKAKPSWEEELSGRLSAPFSLPSDNISQVAQTFAAHGGGAVSLDLALDLKLNEAVKQAQNATFATGAAIALARDGKMVCRATTGRNAPDLGVQVESPTGLSGACLKTGEAQLCFDTETDSRVNAEACRLLGVRSMLILPLTDGSGSFGILEVFSDRPHAFGEADIEPLQDVARKIARNKSEAEHGAAILPDPPSKPDPVSERMRELENQERNLDAEGDSFVESPVPGRNDISSSILVVLVIAAAVSLGVVIGWRVGSHSQADASPAAGGAKQTSSVAPERSPSSAKEEGLTVSTSAGPSSSGSQSRISGTANAAEPASGGLVITQNGKVIYRTPQEESTGVAAATGAAPEPSPTRPVSRVEPEYPAEAKTQRIQGSVVLDVQVLGDGTVGSIAILAGHPLLAEAAVQAVRHWRYEPNVVDGQPVESQRRVTIQFKLPQS